MFKNRTNLYFKIATIFLLLWIAYFIYTNEWYLLKELWMIPATMTFGSFIAGFSAEGGGAVAFPVFTKLLHVIPVNAKQFSLLIQSVGMTMASLFIVSRKIPFYMKAILPAVLGGIIGQLTSLLMGWLITSSHLKWLFTIQIGALGIALVFRHYSGGERINEISGRDSSLLLFITGIIGGFLTINIGSGADMVAFVVLTLIFNSTEKKATPTTVIIMAINSIVGVFLISVFGEWTSWAINAWKTAIPVVILGAPLGAYIASKVSNLFILKALLFFIAIEVVSTIWLVPLPNWVIPIFFVVVLLMCMIVRRGNLKTSLKRAK